MMKAALGRRVVIAAALIAVIGLSVSAQQAAIKVEPEYRSPDSFHRAGLLSRAPAHVCDTAQADEEAIPGCIDSGGYRGCVGWYDANGYPQGYASEICAYIYCQGNF